MLLKLDKEHIKFVETLNQEEKDEYLAVKELLDEFNSGQNILTKKTEDDKKLFETMEEKKENDALKIQCK